MRVQIVEGNFSGQYGNAERSHPPESIVRLDILPDHPMRFSERELIRIASSDLSKHPNAES